GDSDRVRGGGAPGSRDDAERGGRRDGRGDDAGPPPGQRGVAVVPRPEGTGTRSLRSRLVDDGGRAGVAPRARIRGAPARRLGGLPALPRGAGLIRLGTS